MKTKIIYTLKFLFGIFFIIGVLCGLAWLSSYFSDSWIRYVVNIIFGIQILAALNTLGSMPAEFKALILIWKTDNPEELDELLGDLRGQGYFWLQSGSVLSSYNRIKR